MLKAFMEGLEEAGNNFGVDIKNDLSKALDDVVFHGGSFDGLLKRFSSIDVKIDGIEVPCAIKTIGVKVRGGNVLAVVLEPGAARPWLARPFLFGRAEGAKRQAPQAASV